MIRRLVYWYLDYWYVGYWQLRRLFHRYDAKKYLRDPGRPSIPIILIPGIYERWHFMKPVADALHKAGYPIHVVQKLGYNRGRISEMARRVRRYMNEQGMTECIIVAHSKGGLIGKYLLTHDNRDGLIRQVIALNTPFSGSVYAYLTPLRSVREFTPTSRIVTELLAHHLDNGRITSIYGAFDPHIPAGSHLPGAKNVQLPVMGHFRIVSESIVQQAVVTAVRQAASEGPSERENLGKKDILKGQ